MKNTIESMFCLKGKVALITGASRGIGEEIARVFSLAGAKVIICSRKKPGIEEAADRINQGGGEALGLDINVSKAEDRERLVKQAMSWAQRVDILVNNAGANPVFGPLADLSESAWDKVFEVNLKASLFLSQLVYRAWMKENGGVILNISSVGAFKAVEGVNAYNTAKAALVFLTKALAGEWGRYGIRVNALAPGLIKTHMSQVLWEGPFGKKAVEQHPIPRIGEVGDVAGAALLLVSEASSYITGQTLVVDGGQLVATPHLDS